ncbi:MAG: AAA family ATPase [Planctomycetaceae bacterium]|jgi:predicted ATPase|nr:AAA family ATPase [Planctomycetaceae bacterium]
MIEGFWVRNYKSLRQVGIGSCFTKFVFVNDENTVLPYELGPVTLFTGYNGSGKSTAVDVFNFVSDCYRYGVDAACLKRGGFDAVYSQGGKGPLSFGFHYRQKGESDTVTYAVSIYRTKNKVPFIESEILAYLRENESLPVIFLQNGAEKTIRYLAPDKRLTNTDLTKIEFTDHNHLGLAALPEHPKYPVMASLRLLFENWSLCHFTPDPARGLDHSLPHRQESPHGVSLSGLIRYITKRYKDNLKPLFHRVAARIPNVEKIILDDLDPDKPKLSFCLMDRDHPIPITHLSAASIRLFTYAMFFEEEFPPPLTVIEEPENGLDRTFRNKFLESVLRFESAPHQEEPQIILNSHHPAIANGLRPEQVWVFEKDREGFTAVERASDSIMFRSEIDKQSPNWFSVSFDEKR